MFQGLDRVGDRDSWVSQWSLGPDKDTDLPTGIQFLGMREDKARLERRPTSLSPPARLLHSTGGGPRCDSPGVANQQTEEQPPTP